MQLLARFHGGNVRGGCASASIYSVAVIRLGRGPHVAVTMLAVLPVLAVLTMLAACSSAGPRASTLSPADRVVLPAPAGDGRVGIASIVWSGSAWYAAGSFRDADGQHRPGLWTSADAISWTRIETAPITFYGQISELYSVAASPRGLVALGAATGGAHGNPRTVSWVLDVDGTLHEVAAAFELYNGVRQVSVRSVTAGPNGFVILGSRVNRNGNVGAASWTSPDGADFVIHDDDPELSSSDAEQKFGLDIASSGDRVIAVGERTIFSADGGDTDGVAWTSADGVGWTPWAPDGLELGGAFQQRSQRIAIDGARILIAGVTTGTATDPKATAMLAWSTADGRSWKRARIAPFGTSANVLSAATGVALTDTDFIVAGRQGDALMLAASVDGSRWRSVPLPPGLPTGNRATLSVGAHGDTLLVGAQSLDGGGLWRMARSS
jgi:hypothetical protein